MDGKSSVQIVDNKKKYYLPLQGKTGSPLTQNRYLESKHTEGSRSNEETLS